MSQIVKIDIEMHFTIMRHNMKLTVTVVSMANGPTKSGRVVRKLKLAKNSMLVRIASELWCASVNAKS